MEIYELNFVMILLGKTEFFADIHQKSMIQVFFFFYASNQTSICKLISVNKCFCNGIAKGVQIKLCFMIIYKIAKT